MNKPANYEDRLIDQGVRIIELIETLAHVDEELVGLKKHASGFGHVVIDDIRQDLKRAIEGEWR